MLHFKTQIGKIDSLKLHYLEIPVTVVQDLGGKFRIRLLCTVNDQITFQCGLVALGGGRGYITINTKRMKQLGVQLGDFVDVQLAYDTSEFGFDMPEELAEVLAQDTYGMERFTKLTSGKQRYIIYYISQVKQVDLRIQRSIFLIENLKKLPVGNEDFAAMLGKSK